MKSTRIPPLFVALVLAIPAPLFSAGEPIAIVTENARRTITPLGRGDREWIPLDPLLMGTGVGTHPDARASSLKLSFQGRDVTLYANKNLVSVDGDLRLLSAPVIIDAGLWAVPVDSPPRFLAPLLGRRVEWRPGTRVLLLGNVAVPQVNVTAAASLEMARVVFDASEKIPFRVQQEERRVTVAIPRELVDVSLHEERVSGGIVDRLQFLGGRENVVAITMGPRFREIKSFEQDGRLTLEFHAAPAASEAPGTANPPPTTTMAAGPVVVIDPGHGGTEVGAKGPGGTLEKDVTLAIARRLRSALVNGAGVQAFLTRDKDQDLALDDRAAVANNYKAAVFVSIHANSSRSHSARGAEVYFLSHRASDDESRRLALAEGAANPPADEAGASGDLALILWDMAQAEYLEESSALASRLQEALAEATGTESRGVKQAPFRVLVGAAMPAVLVEVAFISNPEEEELLVSDAYQNKVVAALARGITRFEREQQTRSAAPRTDRLGN